MVDNQHPINSSDSLPSQAQIVIIGGGVIGCSIAYHLTKLGRRDIVLLERKELTSGTTWHAAGLIVTPSHNDVSSFLSRSTISLLPSLVR